MNTLSLLLKSVWVRLPGTCKGKTGTQPLSQRNKTCPVGLAPKSSPGVSPSEKPGGCWKHWWKSATYCGYHLSCWPLSQLPPQLSVALASLLVTIRLIARNGHPKWQWLKQGRRLFLLYITFWRWGAMAVVTTWLYQSVHVYFYSFNIDQLCQRFISFISLFENPGLVLFMLAMPVFYFINLCPYLYYFLLLYLDLLYCFSPP